MNRHCQAHDELAERREARLLARIAEADQVALEEMYGLYYPRLNRFLLRLLGSAGQPSLPGLINEVMFVVWNRAASYNHTCKVSSWVFGIAVRVARKHQSLQSGHAARQQELADVPVPVAQQWDARLETEDLLRKALQGLSSEQRAVVELTYFNGLPYSEIADILQCPENTVKTRMYKARQRLQKLLLQLEKAGTPPED